MIRCRPVGLNLRRILSASTSANESRSWLVFPSALSRLRPSEPGNGTPTPVSVDGRSWPRSPRSPATAAAASSASFNDGRNLYNPARSSPRGPWRPIGRIYLPSGDRRARRPGDRPLAVHEVNAPGLRAYLLRRLVPEPRGAPLLGPPYRLRPMPTSSGARRSHDPDPAMEHRLRQGVTRVCVESGVPVHRRELIADPNGRSGEGRDSCGRRSRGIDPERSRNEALVGSRAARSIDLPSVPFYCPRRPTTGECRAYLKS